jgi:hypothetical protein
MTDSKEFDNKASEGQEFKDKEIKDKEEELFALRNKLQRECCVKIDELLGLMSQYSVVCDDIFRKTGHRFDSGYALCKRRVVDELMGIIKSMRDIL